MGVYVLMYAINLIMSTGNTRTGLEMDIGAK